jgi:hypothetical protein
MVVDYIKKNLVVPPIIAAVIKYPAKDTSRGNGKVLKHIFHNKVLFCAFC